MSIVSSLLPSLANKSFSQAVSKSIGAATLGTLVKSVGSGSRVHWDISPENRPERRRVAAREGLTLAMTWAITFAMTMASNVVPATTKLFRKYPLVRLALLAVPIGIAEYISRQITHTGYKFDQLRRLGQDLIAKSSSSNKKAFSSSFIAPHKHDVATPEFQARRNPFAHPEWLTQRQYVYPATSYGQYYGTARNNFQ